MPIVFSDSQFIVAAAVFGLAIGSFLNVVIHRLPRMMENEWRAQCAELEGKEPPDPGRYNLLVPRSQCPTCQTQIRARDNIPVLSWLILGGKCAQCKAKISPRYPIVEALTALLSALVAWKFGLGWAAGAALVLTWTLIALVFIDADTTLLPDDLTLPLLWAGLACAALNLTSIGLPDAFWGAVGGYLSLWLVYWAFKLATGKEGMGYGDFKLFAALGAWFGWQALIPIILMASVIGAVVGIAMKFSSNLREGGYVPFGPFLSMAGLTAMVVGPSAILKAVGL